MHIVYRKTCRVCGSNALTKVIDLGEQYLQGSFVKPGKNDPHMRERGVSRMWGAFVRQARKECPPHAKDPSLAGSV